MFEIHIDPVAFTITGRPVSWYGLIYVLAALVVLAWGLRERRRVAGLSSRLVLNMGLIALFCGLVVSKFFHVIEQWDYFIEHPEQFLDPAGLTIMGAILGAALGIGIYSRLNGLPFRQVFDVAVPGLILAQAIGRAGCAINGCCYGIPTSLPWGVIYTHPGSAGYGASLNLPPGMGLHPTQIYAVIYDLIVFAVLFKLRGRLQPDGSLTLLYAILYSAWRLGSDFLRVGSPFVANLHQAQFLSIIILAIALPLLIYSRIRRVKVDDKAGQTSEA